MRCLDKISIIDTMNELANKNEPFIFVIDFDKAKGYVDSLRRIDPKEMLYAFGNENNIPSDVSVDTHDILWSHEDPNQKKYHNSFNIVIESEKAGNSYLTNLTYRVPISTNLSMRDIFLTSSARYRLWISNQFVCFSPEIFIKVTDKEISSYPMKGTIDANIPNAAQKLMEDKKEIAEHATIVDLIRNDLSMVAEHVRVPKYRYIERLETNSGPILQTSSKIQGRLLPFYQRHPGDLLMKLLPAGSITGAPKQKTVEIIKQAEKYQRGFYTGVMGIWKDGNIDSSVMIRFIDEENGKLYYKAGGGITAQSEEEKEYNEIIEKIYVPIC
jgi:para-aminobenzoate synthetase component 1